MKKLLPGILALLMAFGCLTACGTTSDGSSSDGGSTPPASTPDDSTPAAPTDPHEVDLADVKDYLMEQLAEKDLETYKDFTLPNSFSFIGTTEKFDIAWTSNAAAATIEEGETEDTVKIGNVDEDTPFVLTATVTDPDGCHTTTFTVEGIAKPAPTIVPNPISEAPTENTEYKLYMYQVTKAQDLYFTGKMSGFYLATTNVSQGQTYVDGVDVFVKAVDGKSGYFNLYYADPDDNTKTMYIGVTNCYNNNSWHNNAILSESTTVEAGANTTFEFTYSEEYGTMIATLEGVKSGNDETTTESKTESFWLGTDQTYYTFGAMSVSKIKNSDACVGKLVQMVDKSTIVIPDSKKVADVKASLSVVTKHTLDKELTLKVADDRYEDVTITWSVGETTAATVNGDKLSLVVPAEKVEVLLTATVACGDVQETVDFTLELGPKTVAPADKTDSAAVVAAAFNLAAGETLPGDKYTLTGEITKVNTPYDSQYGNITVTIAVGDNAFECYRLKGAVDETGAVITDASVLKVGDTITVTGVIKNYNGKVEFDTGCILDSVVPGEGGEVNPDEPVEDPKTTKITSAPVETSVYKLYLYQTTNAANQYFTGVMDGFYFASSAEYDEGVELYVEYVDETNFNLFFMDGETRKYIGVKVNGTYNNVIIDTAPVSQFVWNAEIGTMTTTVSSGEFFLGNYSNFKTFSANKISYATTAGNNIGGLVDTGKTVDTLPGATETPDEPDVPVASTNKADFDTITTSNANGDSSYTKTFTTTNGWTVSNSAIQTGGPEGCSNPQFSVIGPNNTYKAVCMTGNTAAPGKILSPVLKDGIAKLTINYTKMFTDTQVGALITITDVATGETYTSNFAKTADKDDKYIVWTYEWVLETAISGDFTIEIVNSCPTQQDSNKDRITILELSWTSATENGGNDGNETPDAPKLPAFDTEITIEKALEVANTFTKDNYTEGKYYIIATVKAITNAEHGNMTITDGTNDLTVYGTWDSTGTNKYGVMTETKPVVGDTVKLYGVLGMYYAAQMKDAWIIEVTPGEQPAAQLPKADTSYYLCVEGNANSYIQGVSSNGKYLTVGAKETAITVIFIAVDGVENGYYIQLSTGEYVNAASSGNSLAFSSTASTVWVVDTATLCIKQNENADGFCIQYNGNAGQERISRYKGTMTNAWFEEVVA